MPRKRRKRPAKTAVPGPTSDVNDRVTWLCAQLWRDNKSAMARDCGVSHTSINRVVSREKVPGRELLTSIAAHPKISPAWVLTGEGEPFVAESGAAASGGWLVPIAKQLLPGSPEDYQHLLGGERFPVPGSYYQPTRFFYEVQPADAVGKSHIKIDGGDLLLMETDATWWSDINVLREQICIVRFQGRDEATMSLAEMTILGEGTGEDPQYLTADVFERLGSKKAATDMEVVGTVGDVEILARPKRKRRQRSPGLGSPIITANDVLAVCVQMIRRWP